MPGTSPPLPRTDLDRWRSNSFIGTTQKEEKNEKKLNSLFSAIFLPFPQLYTSTTQTIQIIN